MREATSFVMCFQGECKVGTILSTVVGLSRIKRVTWSLGFGNSGLPKCQADSSLFLYSKVILNRADLFFISRHKMTQKEII